MKKLLSLISVIIVLATCLAGCVANGGNGTPSASDKLGGAESTSGGASSEAPSVNDKTEESGNILVAYFSCTENTKGIAEKIALASGGKLYRILPEVPYTAQDLNYNNNSSRANKEQNDPASRPKIGSANIDVKDYEIVFLGYPIWWGGLPKIIYTFLESYDLSGKTIIPFCTSGSTGIAGSEAEIATLAPEANRIKGRRFSGSATANEASAWVDSLNLLKKEEITTVKVYCGKNVAEMTLADNPSAKAFASRLKEGDVVVTMKDYGDFEKVGELGFALPETNEKITTSPGDVILYLGTNVTIYYDVNTWNFTKLGKIDGMTRQSMLAFLGGKGTATIKFSLK